MVRRPRIEPENLRLSSIPRRSCRTTPIAPSTSSTSSASRATHGVSSKASPTAPISNLKDAFRSTRVPTCRSTTRPTTPLRPLRHRNPQRDYPFVHGLPRRRLRRGRGAQCQGWGGQAHGAAPGSRLAPVKAAGATTVAARRPDTQAKDLAAELRKYWNIEFDDAGAIGGATAARTRSVHPIASQSIRHARGSRGHPCAARPDDPGTHSASTRWSTTWRRG